MTDQQWAEAATGVEQLLRVMLEAASVTCHVTLAAGSPPTAASPAELAVSSVQEGDEDDALSCGPVVHTQADSVKLVGPLLAPLPPTASMPEGSWTGATCRLGSSAVGAVDSWKRSSEPLPKRAGWPVEDETEASSSWTWETDQEEASELLAPPTSSATEVSNDQ